MSEEEMVAPAWAPRTLLGRLIQEGKVKTVEEIFEQGHRIQEPEIVDLLLPDLQQEVICVDLVQKQTDAGEKSRFRAVVAVGNQDGCVGLGIGKARQVRAAIEKATEQAKLNIFPIRRGCGSWECDCGRPHSLPFKIHGKCGSVQVSLIPGPRGLGLVAGETAKVVLRLAGIKDCWTRVRGRTSNPLSFAHAIFNALKQTRLMSKFEVQQTTGSSSS